ncbi:NAD(P)/FAD-dependent oxidoreductase [Haloechinothrix sp. LS1_15]|uniref:NAD(P)/FAD-dependent oxidoreductase n=1 Tax=Haloechinothrix sp. LS1_15 TaxID=2652248 RepID=UPI002945DBFE|nr:NAD(P)/FAD-dependent oxidoreductase [Haloechinothrix sp. LS1_15]MDV6014283.1 NAD(P)/FAD-dependent oxidoreductase [Haloechinothrix sp. LS1_15]
MTERHGDDADGRDLADVAIVGGGAAGLSAALVLARARRRVLVVDSGAPRNAVATHVHGFLSREGTPPTELLATGRAEVAGYGGEIVAASVRDAVRTGEGFAVRLLDDRTLLARRILLASGLTDELPEVPGLAQRWGRDVLSCPYCHGWEVRDQPLAVLGTGPLSVHHALMLRQWSEDVTLIRHGLTEIGSDDRRRLAARDIRVVDGVVDHVVVDHDRLTGMGLLDGAVVPCAAVFVSARLLANHGVVASLGVEVERDELGERVATDHIGQTSIHGVWAAGNVTDPFAQVIVAAAAGAKVAMALNAELVEDDVSVAVA